jgi:O-antigen/teichoic acid export membrane protein
MERKIYKQYFQLISSTLVMTCVQLAISIILTQSMDSVEFASYKLIMNTILLLQGILSFGMPITLSFMLTGDSDIKGQYIGVCLKFAALSCLAATAVCFILLVIQWNTSLAVIDNIALLFSPLCVIPVFLYYFEYINIGTNNIKLLSRQKLATQLIYIALIGICWILFSGINLTASISTYIAANVIIILYVLKKMNPEWKAGTAVFKELWKVNRRLGLQTYIGSIFSLVSVRALNVIIDSFITKQEYALFSLAVTISAPLGPFISSIGSVMFSRFNKLNEMGRRFILSICGITLLSAIAYVYFIQLFTPIVFGEFYRGSIRYAQVLGVGSLLVGLGDIFNRFVMAKGMGKYIRNGAIITGIVNIAVASALINSLYATGVAISSVASNVTYLALMVISYIITSKRCKGDELQASNG